ncbi:MAG: signal peptide peptidase SppA [Pyrinomonadaceae bacterium]|nr:signal peptide peptidase SppA [Pyrinomonadaceae bacterium]
MAISKTAKTLLIVGGIIFALILVSVIGLILMAETLGKPSVSKNSVLVLSVSGPLPDYAPEDPMADLVGISQPESFTSLITQLRKAKADSRIGAVLLDINFPRIGWGKADELRAAIKDVRDGGKPVYAYMQLGMNQDYYIASAAEKIYLPPAGDIYINGFAANAVFYKGSLDKLGIEPDVIQIGKYKSAPERYTRKDMSEGQREVINAILDQYFVGFVNAIAESRKKSPEDVKALIDGAPYHGNQAKELGLTDGALYKDQVYSELKKRLGYEEDAKLKTISGKKYKEISSDSLGINNGERVAVIYASGAINIGRSNSSPLMGEMVGSDTIIKAVNRAAEDSSIKAIILRVNSPGGSALASDLMWHAIENAKAKKPVVVSMADMAASGGYYIACNANKIVAEPSTLTGSIGVFMGKPVMSGFYDWIGQTNEYVLRGKNAGIFREDKKWSEEERAKMQDQADKIYYTDFVPKVAKGRNMDSEKVNSLGQGRVWTGKQAKENGLIDEIGGLEKAISIAKELAEIPAENEVKRIALPKPPSLFGRFFGSDEDSTFSQAQERKAQELLIKSLPEDARRSLRFAGIFDRMKRGEAMMMLPYELEIK